MAIGMKPVCEWWALGPCLVRLVRLAPPGTFVPPWPLGNGPEPGWSLWPRDATHGARAWQGALGLASMGREGGPVWGSRSGGLSWSPCEEDGGLAQELCPPGPPRHAAGGGTGQGHHRQSHPPPEGHPGVQRQVCVWTSSPTLAHTQTCARVLALPLPPAQTPRINTSYVHTCA